MRNTGNGYLSKRRNSPSAPFYYTHRFLGKVSNRSTILGVFFRKSIHAMLLICHYIKHSFGCCYFSCNTEPAYILLVWNFLTSRTGQAYNKEFLWFNNSQIFLNYFYFGRLETKFGVGVFWSMYDRIPLTWKHFN